MRRRESQRTTTTCLGPALCSQKLPYYYYYYVERSDASSFILRERMVRVVSPCSDSPSSLLVQDHRLDHLRLPTLIHSAWGASRPDSSPSPVLWASLPMGDRKAVSYSQEAHINLLRCSASCRDEELVVYRGRLDLSPKASWLTITQCST